MMQSVRKGVPVMLWGGTASRARVAGPYMHPHEFQPAEIDDALLARMRRADGHCDAAGALASAATLFGAAVATPAPSGVAGAVATASAQVVVHLAPGSDRCLMVRCRLSALMPHVICSQNCWPATLMPFTNDRCTRIGWVASGSERRLLATGCGAEGQSRTVGELGSAQDARGSAVAGPCQRAAGRAWRAPHAGGACRAGRSRGEGPPGAAAHSRRRRSCCR